MIRRIIQIEESKCNGCGLCAKACHEEAIGMVNGKAKLLRDDYCDGLGDCLPTCPTGAITFIEREVAEYDEAAVFANKKAKSNIDNNADFVCPGNQAKQLNKYNNEIVNSNNLVSQLCQWPVQIKLVPSNASYFDNSNLLIAADCTAYAYANFHNDFIRGKITLIGCPKLDSEDYSKKLTEIISNNNIKSLTIVRMEVPCCKGIETAAVTALKDSGKFMPWQIVTISTEGNIIK